MDKQDRKLAISRYKERKSISGVYAVICTATGEVWVGTTRNLEAQKNSLWFALKMKSSPFGNLQQAWNSHGEKEFKFEELDRLKDDFSDLLRSDELKKRRTLWAARLQAVTL
ncbi:MAG TPA: GIY-YIG nuclease family protein [Aestuariivirga sp.]